LAIMCAGTALLSFMTPSTPLPPLMVSMITVGIGMGLLLPVYTIILQNTAEKQTMGIATALSQFFRSIGGTVGTALFGWLMNKQYETLLASNLGERAALIGSVDFVFLIYAVILGATFLLNLSLRELPLSSQK
jgi:MFS family permease